MKSLYIAIITGTGISIIVISTFLFFFMMPNRTNQQNLEIRPSQINTSIITISIEGLNETYLVGQQINFNITTTSGECSRPSITLTNENGSVVWTNRPDPMFCDMMTSWPTTWHWKLDSGDLGTLQVNETGIYKITISLFGKTMEREFSVVSSSKCLGNPIEKRQDNSLVVLLMDPNSTATVCTTYKLDRGAVLPIHGNPIGGGFLDFGFYVGANFHVTAIPSMISIDNASAKDNFTVYYKIYAPSNSKGIYYYSIPWDNCEQYPLAVGYSASDLKKSDFPLEVLLGRTCPVNFLHIISNRIVSGMKYTEVISNGH